MRRTVTNVRWWHQFAIFPVYVCLKLLKYTWRFRVDDVSKIILKNEAQGRIFALWHSYLLVASAVYAKYGLKRPLCGLVSASKDGAWLSALFGWLGIRAVRGSSSWRGAQAMEELTAALNEGCDLAITPDGPRGPREVLKRGVMTLSRSTRTPIVSVAVSCARAWRLSSWDHFMIPKPFSTIIVRLRLHAVDAVEEQGLSRALSERL